MVRVVLLGAGWLLLTINIAVGGSCEIGEAATIYRDEVLKEVGQVSDAVSSIGRENPAVPCGYGTELVKTMPGSVRNLRFPDGTQRSFIPIYLKDKDRWNCTRIKVRNACVVKVERAGNDLDVTLADSATLPHHTSKLRVKPNGDVVYGDARRFGLLPAVRVFGGENRELAKFVPEQARAQTCKRNRDCEYERGYYAERLTLEIYRTQRFFGYPLGWPGDWTTADKSAFRAEFRDLQEPKKEIHHVIVANEIHGYSPNRVIDAIKESSGPSYGPYQIDLATNPREDERKPFRDLVLKLGSEQRYEPELAKLIGQKKFEISIREYDVTTLGGFYTHLGFMNSALRSSAGREMIKAVYQAYLDRSAKLYSDLKLKEPFRSSAILPMMIVDADNVLGGAKSPELRRVVEAKYKERRDVAAAEAAGIAWLMQNGRARGRCEDSVRRLNSILEYHGRTPVDRTSDEAMACKKT